MYVNSRKTWVILFGVFGLGILCSNFFKIDYQSHHFGNGLSVFVSPDRPPGIRRNVSHNCPMRNISMMKKTKRFTHVGLLSYPGSGNTWTRHLIQQLTGFCTGTVYCDKFLHGHGFLGECVFPNHRTKGCIVYKTHENKPKDLKQFDRAVILIRNPYDSLKAYFNWTFGKPVNTSSGNIKTSKKSPKSPRDRFHALVDLSRFNSTEWKSYVKDQCFHWQSVYKVWLKTFVNRSLLVRYVDLKESLVPTLRQISKFLNVTTSEMEYTCTYMNREGQHHRNQKYDLRITDLFTEEQIDMVNGAILNVMAAMKNGYRLKDFIFKPF